MLGEYFTCNDIHFEVFIPHWCLFSDTYYANENSNVFN